MGLKVPADVDFSTSARSLLLHRGESIWLNPRRSRAWPLAYCLHDLDKMLSSLLVLLVTLLTIDIARKCQGVPVDHHLRKTIRAIPIKLQNSQPNAHIKILKNFRLRLTYRDEKDR
jgi:hypothetical protein